MQPPNCSQNHKKRGSKPQHCRLTIWIFLCGFLQHFSNFPKKVPRDVVAFAQNKWLKRDSECNNVEFNFIVNTETET